MMLEIEISEQSIKMMKMLKIAQGGNNQDIEAFISGIIEENLRSQIAAELGFTTVAPTTFGPVESKPISNSQVIPHDPFDENVPDVTDISDGFGDVDTGQDDNIPAHESETVQGEKDPMAGVPNKGAVSASAVENDTVVENPKVEAAAAAPQNIQSEQSAEQTFSQMALGLELTAPAGQRTVEQGPTVFERELPDRSDDPPGAITNRERRRQRPKNPKIRRAKVDGYTGNNGAEAELLGTTGLTEAKL